MTQRGLHVRMTQEQAGRRLREMYDRGKASGKALAAIHLFGIEYASQIAHLSARETVIQPGIRPPTAPRSPRASLWPSTWRWCGSFRRGLSMAEFEEHEVRRPDGSLECRRSVRAGQIRIEFKDDTVTTIDASDWPPEFAAEEYDGDRVFGGTPPVWRLHDYFFEILHRRVREAGVGTDLIPRTIAFLSEHGEPLLTLANLFIHGTRSLARPRPMLLGYETDD